MLASAPSSELIRVIVIIAFAAMSLILRAKKKPDAARSAPGRPPTTPLDTIREAMRQGAEQGRVRRQQSPFQSASPQLSDSFNQPPAIKPESPVFPSLLLLALFACLCYMAYRYFAG
jgi:hypothetical protein